MKEIEITEIPPLAPNERSLLAMHSLLNVLNVLRGELTLIGLILANDDALLRRSMAASDTLIRRFRDSAASLESAREIEQFVATVLAEIAEVLAQRPAKAGDPEVVESQANLVSVFTILRVLARELLSRAKDPDQWTEYSVEQLRQGFFDVFSALEKNSRGRFHIIYNAARQQPKDYYIDFKLESVVGDCLRMPPVFQDVMRDLIANARKYTAPGGHITAALYAGETDLRFVVEDTGRGIPDDEIATVVHFGRRASNVSEVRTMGGGFGLTKAFLVTKQFGGRFWIASRIGRGTRVRIELPRPAARAGGI